MMSLVSFLTIFSFCHLNRFESFILSAHTIGTEQGMCRQKETCISAPSKKHKSNWKEIPKIPIHCSRDFCCVKERFPFIKKLQLRDDIKNRWDGSNSIKADRGPQSKNLKQRLHGSERERFFRPSTHAAFSLAHYQRSHFVVIIVVVILSIVRFSYYPRLIRRKKWNEKKRKECVDDMFSTFGAFAQLNNRTAQHPSIICHAVSTHFSESIVAAQMPAQLNEWRLSMGNPMWCVLKRV